MKHLHLLTLLLLSATTGFAQGPVVIFKCTPHYIYNEQKDTLTLSKPNLGQFCFCDPVKLVDSIQIDGQGAKELVLFGACHGRTEDHGGTFDISEKKRVQFYEIWNLDTQEMLFKAICSYQFEYANFRVYMEPSYKMGVESYSYNFEIDAHGKITISNTTAQGTRNFSPFEIPSTEKGAKESSKIENYSYTPIPDKAEGTYSFQNGQYVLEE